MIACTPNAKLSSRADSDDATLIIQNAQPIAGSPHADYFSAMLGGSKIRFLVVFPAYVMIYLPKAASVSSPAQIALFISWLRPATICPFFSLSSVVRFASYCSSLGGSLLEAGIRRSHALIVFSEPAS